MSRSSDMRHRAKRRVGTLDFGRSVKSKGANSVPHRPDLRSGSCAETGRRSSKLEELRSSRPEVCAAERVVWQIGFGCSFAQGAPHPDSDLFGTCPAMQTGLPRQIASGSLTGFENPRSLRPRTRPACCGRPRSPSEGRQPLQARVGQRLPARRLQAAVCLAGPAASLAALLHGLLPRRAAPRRRPLGWPRPGRGRRPLRAPRRPRGRSPREPGLAAGRVSRGLDRRRLRVVREPVADPPPLRGTLSWAPACRRPTRGPARRSIGGVCEPGAPAAASAGDIFAETSEVSRSSPSRSPTCGPDASAHIAHLAAVCEVARPRPRIDRSRHRARLGGGQHNDGSDGVAECGGLGPARSSASDGDAFTISASSAPMLAVSRRCLDRSAGRHSLRLLAS